MGSSPRTVTKLAEMMEDDRRAMSSHLHTLADQQQNLFSLTEQLLHMKFCQEIQEQP